MFNNKAITWNLDSSIDYALLVSCPDYFSHAKGKNSERAVCVSELDNWQCEVSELQMSIRLSQGFLRLTEASCYVNLRFLAFGSAEKDDPCKFNHG